MTDHCFSDEQREGLYRAIRERRDVRSQFLPDPIAPEVLARLLHAAHRAPSVGFMQPWDFLVIDSIDVKRAVKALYDDANADAAANYSGDRAALYRRLKLEGIVDSPINLCITCDRERTRGSGLGRQSDPATDLYSTACAVQNLLLAARAESVGAGWVSILDFDRLRDLLGIPAHVIPVAYLCLGYVSGFPTSPELESSGWENRENLARLIHFDSWDGGDERRASEFLPTQPLGSRPR